MTSATAALEIASGAREVEDALLEAVSALASEARRDPLLFARPVRIVVPSRSLRLHVSSRLVEHLGAVAGVTVQTLHAVAVEVLERAGASFHGSDELVGVLARRLAREQPSLRAAFEPFIDGYRSAAGTLRDLLDAGFEPSSEEAVLDRLAELKLPVDKRRRASELVAAARAVAEHLETHALGGRAELLRRAREALMAAPAELLPTRQLLVHGFADATGRASELIESLVKHTRTRVFLDHPPDPDEPTRKDLGVAFTQRLSARLAGHTGKALERAGTGRKTELSFFRAPGAEAEVRQVARRIRTHLDEGAVPESIGIVARDLGPYHAALRTQLGRLGIPCSGLRARAPLDGPGRRIRGLCELFVRFERSSADRWLDAVASITTDEDGERRHVSPTADLRLALRVVGAVRLDEAAALEARAHLDDKGRVVLPVRSGLSQREEGTGDFIAPRRRLAGSVFAGALAAARSLLRRLARWPRQASLAAHLAQLERLRRHDLGWQTRDVCEQRIAGGLERLAEAFPEEELSLSEFALILERTLSPLAFPLLGGAGGGVQVLDAMEARARTFEHLFVIGLNRGAFPRAPHEDALLSDDLRAALADLLPDIPIKARSRDEDRYLFAQLLSASPRVTLSWQLADDDGKPQVISPLVERLLREQDESSVEAAPPLYPQEAARAFDDRLRPARELAILCGLAGGHESAAPYLPLALAEGNVARAEPVAAARQRVLAAFEDPSPTALLPWLGFLGAQADDAIRPDPRRVPLYVTRFEAAARCPWKTVLEKLLRLEQVRDPLDSLPGVEPLLLGNVVHATLEAIAQRTIGDDDVDLATALERQPQVVPWPAEKELDELLQAAALRELYGRFPPYPGLLRMIVEIARPYVLRARELTEQEGGRVFGVEALGQAVVSTPSGDIRVDFKADRVEDVDGALFLTDYKTGRVLSRKDFTDGLRRGANLQPLVYGLANGTAEREVWGRYLYLKPEIDEKLRPDVGLSPAEREAALPDAARALGLIQEAWLAGAFFPRFFGLRQDKEPAACRFCDVAHACLRGDSGARRRLVQSVRDTGGGQELAAMRALWMLGEPPEKAKRGRK